jgi:FixJ family two-component response regulator
LKWEIAAGAVEPLRVSRVTVSAACGRNAMHEIPKVFLVDDDPQLLRGLSRIFMQSGYSVECFVSPLDAIERASYDGPACFVVDLNMPQMSGLEFQEAVLKTGCRIPLLFLSGEGDIPTAVKALQRGALDFLVKPLSSERLLGAVAEAVDAHRKALAGRLEWQESQERFQRLSPRERQVAQLVARGLLNKQISFELGLAERTVKLHRARIMTKLEVGSVADLVRLMERLPPAGAA